MRQRQEKELVVLKQIRQHMLQRQQHPGKMDGMCEETLILKYWTIDIEKR